jgi:hypothetical protein
VRSAVVTAALLAALLTATAAGGAAAPRTDLRIAFWPEGRNGGTQAQVWRLRCGPVSGTHPRRTQACRRLAAVAEPFRPVPRVAICTQVYGGPQEALVTGRHQGRRIWVRVHRRDGCHIARWDRHVPVLPAAGGV